MTTINDTNNHDHFLEEFPLTPAELDRLLLLYSRYYPEQEKSATASNSDNNLNNLSDWIDQITTSRYEENGESATTPISLLNELENNILPPKLGLELVKRAITMSSTFSFSPTATDESNNIQNQKLFLEAIVTCLGRRGPRPILQLLHGYACGITAEGDSSSCGDAAKDNMNGSNSPSATSPLADTTILIDMTYRLAIASHLLLKHMSSGDGTSSPDNATLPLPPLDEICSPLGMIKSLSMKENCLKSPDHRKVSLATWMDWATWTAPQIYTTVSTFMHTVLLVWNNDNNNTNNDASLDNDEDCYNGILSSGGPQILTLPSCISQKDDNRDTSSFWNTPHDIVPFLMATLSCSLQGSWQRLYSSMDDGYSFLRLQQALLGYKGPTVLLIRTTEGDEFGYYTECPWKLPLSPTKKWFFGSNDEKQNGGNTKKQNNYTNCGGLDSFLFGLSPQLALYPSTGQGQHYMYLNPSSAASSRYRYHENEMFGLAMGGFQPDCPRVYLTEDFENCRATSIDTTYESGPLLSNDQVTFDVDVVEAWAVASLSTTNKVSSTTKSSSITSTAATAVASSTKSSSSLSSTLFFEQCRQGGRQEEDIREARRLHVAHVDRTQFLEDFQNGNVYNDIFKHRDQVRGRADFEVDELHGGYVLEEFKSQEWDEEEEEDGGETTTKIATTSTNQNEATDTNGQIQEKGQSTN